MNKITINGCPPWDGVYPFENLNLTNRELNRIKTITAADGAAPIRAAELIEALVMDDSAAVVALTAVVLAREGKAIDPDELWDAAAGAITLELGVDDDAGPPTTASSESEPIEPVATSGDGSESGGG